MAETKTVTGQGIAPGGSKTWENAREIAQARADRTGATHYAFPDGTGVIAVEIYYPKSGVEFETFRHRDQLAIDRMIARKLQVLIDGQRNGEA